MKPSYGVIVGRFQVNDLHDGHMELFRQVRSRHNGVIVFVGVHPAGISVNHPLDFPVRKAMIQAKFPEFTVLPLKDTRTDELWSTALDAAIDSVITGTAAVTLYGGRDSFVPHYKGHYTPVELALPIETQKVSGTDIRNEFANKVIESPDFRAGMIYASAHQYPVVYPTVDVAIFSTDYTELCLGRKPTDPKNKWRFIGGFAEKTRPTYEADARTEALEEASADTGVMEYIGSANIPDWRMAGLPDKGIKTTFFATTVMSMMIKAGDDIEEVKWFKVNRLTADDFVDTHQVLYAMLRDWSVKKHLTPPHLYGPTDRPESAGNALRQAINKQEEGALRFATQELAIAVAAADGTSAAKHDQVQKLRREVDPDPTSILPRDNSVDPTRILG
jgi:bifunctional NMN adenylyltransferase/nudix hydrolase